MQNYNTTTQFLIPRPELGTGAPVVRQWNPHSESTGTNTAPAYIQNTLINKCAQPVYRLDRAVI